MPFSGTTSSNHATEFPYLVWFGPSEYENVDGELSKIQQTYNCFGLLRVVLNDYLIGILPKDN